VFFGLLFVAGWSDILESGHIRSSGKLNLRFKNFVNQWRQKALPHWQFSTNKEIIRTEHLKIFPFILFGDSFLFELREEIKFWLHYSIV
jgi:hypothetical protein